MAVHGDGDPSRRSPRCCKPDDSAIRHCAQAREGAGKVEGEPEDRPEDTIAPFPGVTGRRLWSRPLRIQATFLLRGFRLTGRRPSKGGTSMHIMEGFLPVEHALGWTLASAPFVVIRRPVAAPATARAAGAADAARRRCRLFLRPLGAQAALGDRQLLAPDRRRPRRAALRADGDGAGRPRRPALPGAAAGTRRFDDARRQPVLDGHRRFLRRRRALPRRRLLHLPLAVCVFAATCFADLRPT
jgi:hypothetical protein